MASRRVEEVEFARVGRDWRCMVPSAITEIEHPFKLAVHVRACLG